MKIGDRLNWISVCLVTLFDSSGTLLSPVIMQGVI